MSELYNNIIRKSPYDKHSDALIKAFLIMIEYYKDLNPKDLFYINENGLICSEEWQDIPDYIGKYQGSNLGRLRSLTRHVKHPKRGLRLINGKILKQGTYGSKYLNIRISKNGIGETKEVHVLIAMCFLNHTTGNRKIVVDHIKNKEKTNNCIWNLQIITQRKNSEKDKTPKSKLYGVIENKYSTFTSQVTFEGNTICLGIFKDKLEAKKLHDKAILLINNNCSAEDLLAIKQKNIAPKGSFSPRITKSGKFKVRITKNKTIYHIGTFNTLKDAEINYNKSLIDIDNNCFKCLTDNSAKGASGEKYIYLVINKFKVIVPIKGVRKNIGAYKTIGEAIIVRDRVLATGA